jgi:hypothetical protein
MMPWLFTLQDMLCRRIHVRLLWILPFVRSIKGAGARALVKGRNGDTNSLHSKKDQDYSTNHCIWGFSTNHHALFCIRERHTGDM